MPVVLHSPQTNEDEDYYLSCQFCPVFKVRKCFCMMQFIFVVFCQGFNASGTQVTYSQHPHLVGTVAITICDSSHYQYGPTNVTCQSDGNWNYRDVFCLKCKIFILL